MKSNPNLWSVKYSHVDAFGVTVIADTWVLAASLRGAEQKGKRCARLRGHRRVEIDRVKRMGTIDAF